MARSLGFLTGGWPNEDGWPYPDISPEEADEVDLAAEVDDDLVALHAAGTHVLDTLGPVERWVVTARFGLDGASPRSMREIQHELGLPRAQLRVALGDGLAKVRSQLD